MNEPKRHHSVPEMLQRRFADGCGRLWFFDKDRPELGIRDTSASSLFVRNRQYTLKQSDGSRDWSLETIYSELEGEMHVLIDKVVPAVMRSGYPGLAPLERELLYRYIYEQWRRVPEVYDKLISDEAFATMHQATVAEYEKKYPHRPVTEEQRNKFADPGYLKAERQRARVLSLSRPSSTALAVAEKKGLYFVRTAPNRSFLIGSAPVVKLTPPGRSDQSMPDVELWLAIHPNVAIVLAGDQSKAGMMSLPAGYVRYINHAIAKQSEVFAGRDKALVASVARNFGCPPRIPF
jgi:hypothetical protein